MYYDAYGRPDPSGHYEIRDGKLVGRVLRPGEHVSFDLSFADAAPSAGRVFLNDAATAFTDAERTFADSAEGQMLVAKARGEHRMRHAYRSDGAPAFTDAMAAEVIRSEVAQRANAQAFIDQYTAETDRMREAAEAARRLRNSQR